MTCLWATLLSALNALWLASVVFGLPGTWLMVATALLVAWWQGGDPATGRPAMFSLATLIVVTALAGLAELVEFLAGALASGRAGGTRRGAAGAVVGGIVGGIVGTVVVPVVLIGSLVGACAGAGLGALGAELIGGRQWRGSLRVGLGAGAGTLLGRGAKLIGGLLIWLIVTVAAFWP